jgi:predicted nucleic acid-binding protein
VVSRLQTSQPEIAVDPIVLGELRFGIVLLSRGRRRARLEQWFEEGVRRLQCIPWDASSGLCWAQLLGKLRADGRDARQGQPDRGDGCHTTSRQPRSTSAISTPRASGCRPRGGLLSARPPYETHTIRKGSSYRRARCWRP